MEDLRLDVAGAERCAARLGEELLFSTEDLYQLTEKAGPGGLSSHGILVHRGCWEVALGRGELHATTFAYVSGPEIF